MKAIVQSTNGLVKDEIVMTVDEMTGLMWIIADLNRRGIAPQAGLVQGRMKAAGIWGKDYNYWSQNWRGWIFSTISGENGAAVIRLKKKGVSH